MAADRVQIKIGAAGVATVTMVRTDKHNALDQAMFEGLADAAERLAADPSVRAVVLHGEGKSFCSGLDIAGIMGSSSNGDAMDSRLTTEAPNYFQRAGYDWIALPVPVIAAIHGNCLGGGLQIALGADIRISTPDAKLSVMEVKWGLIPDMSITRTLPRLVGIDVAKELTYTARVFSGEEGAKLGVVTRLSDDPFASAMELASEIASKSPTAVRHAKRLYDEAWTGPPAETLALEATLQRELIGSPNQMAAIASGFTRQPAVFPDP